MKNFYSWFLLLTVVFSADGSQAETRKIIGVTLANILTVDRRPEKDLFYSRCVGLVKTENDNQIPTAIGGSNQKDCPNVNGSEVEVVGRKRVLLNQGSIVTDIVQISDGDFDASHTVSERPYKFFMFPSKVTVSVPSMSDPARVVEDTFCVALLKSKVAGEEKSRKNIIACDDCRTVKACFETKLSIKPFESEPGTPHAQTSPDSSAKKTEAVSSRPTKDMPTGSTKSPTH